MAALPLGTQLQRELMLARSVCETSPADSTRWAHLGRTHAALDEFAAAAECFRRAVQIDPDGADGWHNLGTALKKSGRRAEALEAFRKTLSLDPKRADTYVNLGNLLIEDDQFDNAVTCFERAAQLDPTLAPARSLLGQQVAQQGRVREAEGLFRQALALDPDHVPGWMGLGRMLEDAGNAEGALACYQHVLARRPDHALAVGQYFALLRQQAPELLLTSANACLAEDDIVDEARALIGYGLAKYHDRLGNVAEAARAASVANLARRRTAGPLVREGLEQRVSHIIASYDADFFSQRRRLGLGTDQPVFIVGMPRSGTTLCEQILSSHPRLHGAGELPDLANLSIAALDGADGEPWEAAPRLTEMQSRELGLRYLKALRNGAPHDRLRISDKQPLNFFQLAFAALLFPNARVIHCTRDARDTALSIWMENFNVEQRYATDFDDLAFFQRQYRRLMTHWERALPLRILEVRYEDTVANLEMQARKIMGFLAVPWDERCLDFHRNQRAVQTPSRWQVRQPIYSSSVGRWQRYAPFLPPLASAFDCEQ